MIALQSAPAPYRLHITSCEEVQCAPLLACASVWITPLVGGLRAGRAELWPFHFPTSAETLQALQRGSKLSQSGEESL